MYLDIIDSLYFKSAPSDYEWKKKGNSLCCYSYPTQAHVVVLQYELRISRLLMCILLLRRIIANFAMEMCGATSCLYQYYIENFEFLKENNARVLALLATNAYHVNAPT